MGDLGLDVWVTGRAERISPESPVPVLEWRAESTSLAMAGNVWDMIRDLGGRAILASVVGYGGSFPSGVGCIIERDPARCTTTKTRFLGLVHGRQRPMPLGLRLDREIQDPVPDVIATRLLERLSGVWGGIDALIISDYGKGVCTPLVCRTAIREARRRSVPIIVDPYRNADWSLYEGANCIKCNRLEAVGKCPTPHAEIVIETRDSDGAALYRMTEPWPNCLDIPGIRRETADPTGCGDQFAAALALAVAAYSDWTVAAGIANVAGGMQAERVGCDPITADELEKELCRSLSPKITHASPSCSSLVKSTS